MRENLKKARLDMGMTQQAMADRLFITLRYYQKIESGDALGAISLWDAMEDLFLISQRDLRYLNPRCVRASNQ
jgi:Uncharacterized protein conserved in bacteria